MKNDNKNKNKINKVIDFSQLLKILKFDSPKDYPNTHFMVILGYN